MNKGQNALRGYVWQSRSFSHTGQDISDPALRRALLSWPRGCHALGESVSLASILPGKA